MNDLTSTLGMVGGTEAEGLPAAVTAAVPPPVDQQEQTNKPPKNKVKTEEDKKPEIGVSFKGSEAAEFGRSSTKEINLNKDLKKDFEDVLEVFVSQMKQFQKDTGVSLTETQTNFLKLYYENKSKLLDTPEGWMLANLVMEQEIDLRLGSLALNLVRDHKGEGLKPAQNLSTIVVEERGTARKIARKTVRVLVSPIWGAVKISQSLAKHNKVEFKFDSYNQDLSQLPKSTRRYLEYLGQGINKTKSAEFILQIIEARSGFYQALGYDPKEIDAATPFSRTPHGRDPILLPSAVPSVHTAEDTINMMSENLDVRWVRYRNQVLKEIQQEGVLADGTTPINWSDSSHIAWVNHEAQSRTIHRFSDHFVQEISRKKLNEGGIKTKIDERINELTGARITQLEKEIEGRVEVNNRPASQGRLTKLQKELAELKKQREEEAPQTKSQKKRFDESRAAYTTSKAEEQAQIDAVAVVKSRIRQIKTEIQRIEKRHKRLVKIFHDTPEYKIYLREKRKLQAEGIRTIEEITTEITPLTEDIIEQVDRDLQAASIPLDSPRAQTERRKALNNNQNYLALNTELYIANKRWKEFDLVAKPILTEETRLKQGEETELNKTNEKLSAAEEELYGKVTARSTARKTRKKNFESFKLESSTNRSFEARIRIKEDEITAEQERLNQLKEELFQAKKKDYNTLPAAKRKKIQDLEAIQSALDDKRIIDSVVYEAVQKGLEINDLTDPTLKQDLLGSNEEIGYQRMLDHLFPFLKLGINDGKKVYQRAVRLLPKDELAQILYDTLKLDQLPPTRRPANPRDLTQVFTTIRTHRKTQDLMGQAFLGIMEHLEDKAKHML